MRVFLLLLPESHRVSARWREAEVLQIYAAVKNRGWDYHGYTWMCLKQHPIKVHTQKFYQQRIYDQLQNLICWGMTPPQNVLKLCILMTVS